MAEPFHLAVYIGRLNPFTEAHLANVRLGLDRAARLLVLTGSAGQPRSYRVPFVSEEVADMVRSSLSESENSRVTIVPLPDAPTDELWVASVDAVVRSVLRDMGRTHAKVALVGRHKDFTSAYLDLFPYWTPIETPAFRDLSATQIREAYFKAEQTSADRAFICENLPVGTQEVLEAFVHTQEFVDRAEEYAFVARYKANYAKLDDAGRPVPSFPPVFVTLDSVVICAGYVLMIQRGKHPGKGMWALPGGFLNENERLRDGWIRELIEETRLDSTEKHLRDHHEGVQVFDDPNRDPRGRIITFANLIVLPDTTTPGIWASDDAAGACWRPLDTLAADEIYSDHFEIILSMYDRYLGAPLSNFSLAA